MISGYYNFPAQAVLDVKKQDPQWQKDCIDCAIASINDKGEKSIRKSRFNKLKNYNFWNRKLDRAEMRRVTDPFGINPEEMPVNIKHYPLINSKIDVLAGEELSMRTEWVVRAMTTEVLDAKEEVKKDEILKFLMQEIQSDEQFDKFKLQKKLENLDEFIKYSLQDVREIKSDRILQWAWRNPDFDLKNNFNRAFYDLMIAAEEIMCIDIIGGEPTPRKCNPLNVYTLGNSDTIFIDDSDVIVEDGYFSPGWIIDRYNEHLTNVEIQRIENRDTDIYQNPVFSITNWGIPNAQFSDTVIDTEIIEVDRIYGNQYGNLDGVYCAKTVWKSLRKLGDLKYYDEDGNEQHRVVPEQYKINRANGEEVEWYWEVEWWQGTRILDDIYVDIKPVPGNKCPYVGIVANVNVNRAMSMIDKAKELNMLYDIFMYRLEFMYAKYTGPILEIDVAKKPDDFTLEQWVYYAQTMNLMVVDSFREINRGSATGTLAGNMNTTGKVLNMDIGSYIQSTMQMLISIVRSIDDITGVSPARQGSQSNIETVGGIERSVQSSSNSTKYWFNLHSKFQERFLNRYLNFCQFAWEDKKKKLQFIMGDLSTVIEEIDGKLLSNIDLCVFVTSSPEDQQLLQLTRLAMMDSIKQGNGTMSMLLKSYHSNSMAEITKKIEIMENKKMESEQQQAQQQQEANEKQLAQNQQFHEEEMDIQREGNRIKEEASIRQTEVEYAKIKGSMPTGEDELEIEKPLDRDRFELDKDIKYRDLEIKQKALDLKKHQVEVNKVLEEKKLAKQTKVSKA